MASTSLIDPAAPAKLYIVEQRGVNYRLSSNIFYALLTLNLIEASLLFPGHYKLRHFPGVSEASMEAILQHYTQEMPAPKY